MTELLLEATGVEKRYGAVTALRDASLAIRPGEIHALMGANGAGKSTLVKVLTGAVKPDGGTVRLRGQERIVHSPAEARRTGMVSVYQEPAIIPDLTVAENLALTETPVDAFREQIADLGIPEARPARPRARPAAGHPSRHRPGSGPGDRARRPAARRDDRRPAGRPHRPRARRRSPVSRGTVAFGDLHLASHARGRRPVRPRDRPARGQHGGRGRHRPGSGAEEQIVTLMLGPAASEGAVAPPPTTAARPRLRRRRAEACRRAPGRGAQPERCVVRPARGRGARPRRARGPGPGRAVRHPVRPGSSRSRRDPRRRHAPSQFRHPADAIRAGIVLVPADRSSALLMQRSVRENIGLPRVAPVAPLGPDQRRRPRSGASPAAIDRLQIDTRAQSEVRRLSGGNQQKVTIARWLESGVRTFLFYDPTRGIDIRHEAGDLPAGARAGGRRRGRAPAHVGARGDPARLRPRASSCSAAAWWTRCRPAGADEPTLLRAAHGLRASPRVSAA